MGTLMPSNRSYPRHPRTNFPKYQHHRWQLRHHHHHPKQMHSLSRNEWRYQDSDTRRNCMGVQIVIHNSNDIKSRELIIKSVYSLVYFPYTVLVASYWYILRDSTIFRDTIGSQSFNKKPNCIVKNNTSISCITETGGCFSVHPSIRDIITTVFTPK
jgi:hypothetical protein